MALPHQGLPDQAVDRNFRDLDSRVSGFDQRVFYGSGVPTFTPPGRAIFIRSDGGAGSTLYVWEGAAWAAK